MRWINTAALRMDKQIGRPIVIAFWDSSRGVSMRPLAELQRWHDLYAERGLRAIAVHIAGEGPGGDPNAVDAAVRRLGLTLPVACDEEYLLSDSYGLTGVPSRYVFDHGLRLVDVHFGLGGGAEVDQLLEALIAHSDAHRVPGAEPEPEPAGDVAEGDDSCDQSAALDPAKQPRLRIHPPSFDLLPAPLHDQPTLLAPVPAEVLPGSFRGAYSAAAVWALVRGQGTIEVGDRSIVVDAPGAYLLSDHGTHTAASLDLTTSGGVELLEVQLEPGTAA